MVRIRGTELNRSDVEAVLTDARGWSAQELLELADVGPAQKFVLWIDNRCFDAVAIVKLALLRCNPGASLDGVQWNAKTVQDPLVELGFRVEQRRGAPSAKPTGLSSALQAVLDLQRSYEARMTDPMRERGKLVTETIRESLQLVLERGTDQPRPLLVEGSNGMGSAAKVPWIRLFDEKSSPSATQGFYVTFLFAADGSRVCLSVQTGVFGDATSRRALPTSETQKKVDSARVKLGCPSQLLHDSDQERLENMETQT